MIAQTHQDHLQVGPDSHISSEVFLFSFRKLEKEKKKIRYLFLKWGVYLSNKVLNMMMMMNTAVLHKAF